MSFELKYGLTNGSGGSEKSPRSAASTSILLFIVNDIDGTDALFYLIEKEKYNHSLMPKTKIIASRE